VLANREKRIEKLDIRPLDPATRRGLTERWEEVQTMIHCRALFEELVYDEAPADREPEPAH